MWAGRPIIALGKQKNLNSKENSKILSSKIKIGKTHLNYDRVKLKQSEMPVSLIWAGKPI